MFTYYLCLFIICVYSLILIYFIFFVYRIVEPAKINPNRFGCLAIPRWQFDVVEDLEVIHSMNYLLQFSFKLDEFIF